MRKNNYNNTPKATIEEQRRAAGAERRQLRIQNQTKHPFRFKAGSRILSF